MTEMSKPKPNYKFATLNTLSADQIHTIRNLPPHEDFVAPVVDATRPVSEFQSQERFDLETEKLFRKRPMPISLSVILPDPGSVVAYDDYGVPLILTRDKAGVVRAFLNACQHKGAMLVEDCEVHSTGRMSCPYHAWTYGLDGKLIGVPRQETFAKLDKATHGLAQLPCLEAGGVIWVILDKDAEADFSSIPDQLRTDLDALGLGSAYLYGKRNFDVKANWKLVLEPFLEGYHVQRLHAATVGPLFADGCTTMSVLGNHIRQISGKIQFKPELLDDPGLNIHSLITITYQSFPNLIVITSPYYISVFMIVPTGPQSSKINYHMLTLEPPASDKAEELYSRSYSMIQSVFGGEDFRAAEISQKGLSSGALKELVYCGLEEAIVIYYNNLDAVLGVTAAA